MTQPFRPDDGPLSPSEIDLIHAWWRAANYLSVGQIYLLDNPLLKEPLTLAHIKPRLLGHWGTTPGLNFLYAHLNRVIKTRDLDVIFIAGPGHGGPGVVASSYLEGTYSEVYPNVPQSAHGMQRLFRQFSFPGGIPSHASPETPGSMHEGGELGYSLSHAYGAAFDNPDLVVACVVGDGEAETGPLATSWHSNKFLDPVHDGAVLPILHLNGYKIANPTVLARIPEDELRSLMVGLGYKPHFVSGDDPAKMHQIMARTFDLVFDEIAEIQGAARRGASTGRPVWPMIVLKTPKGWTGPKEVDGQKTEGFLALAPGSALRVGGKTGARRPAARLDAELPPERAVRRRRRAEAGNRRARARGRPPHERQPARQRRRADARPRPARPRALRNRGEGAGRGRRQRDRRDGGLPARRHGGERASAATSGCSAPTRRSPTGSGMCSR